ncbi:hypothetical protein [Spirosoma pulveris]
MDFNKNVVEFILAQKVRENRLEMETTFNQTFEKQEKTLSEIIDGLKHANVNKYENASLI